MAATKKAAAKKPASKASSKSPRKSPQPKEPREKRKPTEVVEGKTKWLRFTGGANFWEPEEGETLEGTVTALSSFNGQYGEQRVVSITTAEDRTFKLSESSGLQDWFDALDVGMKVRVTYQGKMKLKSGNNFKAYDALIKQ